MKRSAALSALTRLVCGLFAVSLLLPAFARADAPAASPVIAEPDAAASPEAVDPAEQQMEATLKSLRPQKGKITLKDGIAELNVPEEFRYLDPADTKKVLVDLWSNPPDSADGTLGMLIPADFASSSKTYWGATISYNETGYISDEDADKINYNDKLKELQKSQEDANAERVKAGYRPLHLVGWAEAPRYDKATKKMYWAMDLQSADSDRHSLNYDIRILGRRGVLILGAIAPLSNLDVINTAAPQMLATVNFNQGHRYADFDPRTDKKAAFGLAALIGGGLLVAKAGGFKALIVAVLAFKKFIIIGVVAAAGFVKKLFGGGTKVNTGPAGLPPSSGPGPTGLS